MGLFHSLPPIQWPSARSIGEQFVPSAVQLQRFRYWHVESLLNQAADLLDRCLKDRSEYNSLRAQGVLLNLETLKASTDLAILDDRVAAGMLEQELLQLDNDAGSNKGVMSELNELDKTLRSIDPWNSPNSMPSRTVIAMQIRDNETRRVQTKFTCKSLAEKTLWQQKENEFRKRELESTRLHLNKKLANMENDGAFSFGHQADAVYARMNRDYKDAAVRLQVVSRGMQLLYGYKEPFALTDTDENGSRIDVAVDWVRTSIMWLTAFAQLDQAFVRCISVRDSVGEDMWDAATRKAAETGHLSVSFRVNEQRFLSHRFVRLRGISAFAIEEKGSTISLEAELSLPKAAVSWQETTVPIDIEQKLLPSCHLGRVVGRGSAREPEIGGAIALMNASPIGVAGESGEFGLKLRSPISKSEFKHLLDCQIELTAVGHPRLDS